MPTLRPTLAIVLFALLFTPPLSAQQEEEVTLEDLEALGIRIDEQVSVEHILVPVVVRRSSGPVFDLTKKDFRLLVDDQRIPVETFERGAGASLSLVVLHDLSGSMAHMGKLDAGLEAVTYFLDRFRPRDEMALATFTGGRTDVEVPFTSDVAVLRESMTLWKGWGTTALYDAVARLPGISVEGRSGKRAALLITDGVDNASDISPREAQLIVQRAELPVYVLGLETYRLHQDNVFRYADLLRLLANGTGGRYYSVTNLDEARAASIAILTELRSQYVLGFTVRGYGAEAYRRIEVKAKRSRTRVVHRRGYQGTAPAAFDD